MHSLIYSHCLFVYLISTQSDRVDFCMLIPLAGFETSAVADSSIASFLISLGQLPEDHAVFQWVCRVDDST